MQSQRAFLVIWTMLVLFLLRTSAQPPNTNDMRCLLSEPFHIKQIFGIDVYHINHSPSVPVIRKNICVTGAPCSLISFGDVHFNLFNATFSTAACEKVYHNLICSNVQTNPVPNCKHANQIIFAAMQQINSCRTDLDCQSTNSAYVLPLLWCDWMREISNDVCATPKDKASLRVCEEKSEVATRIRNSCYFTDPVCTNFILNMQYIAPATGVCFFSLVYLIIRCTAKWFNLQETGNHTHE